ncbi:phage minor head protein [Xanthobacter sp. VTT E-85241]|uniref:phage minor head protein n=1 Tax=Roseixanthobacter finlandensis TaxID=3119922 RepID=UPI003726255C
MASNRSIDKLIEDWTPQLRRAFLDAVYAMRDRVQVELLVTMLERGDVDGAIRAVNLDPVLLRGLDASLAQAFEAGGANASGSIPALREASGHVLKVLFDVRNPAAEAWLSDHSSQRVTEIVEDTRTMLRQRLTAGMEAGQNPRTVALDIAGKINKATGRREGGLIGLTSSQEEWVRSYSERLRSGDPVQMREALGMSLRDKRFDRSVEKAIRNGEPIPAASIDKMVQTYKNRAVLYRAETIGRTEAMTSLHQAQDEAWSQAIAKGQVEERVVTKIWRSAGDNKVRHTHTVLNGQKVPFRGIFVSPSGARLRYPGDPNAPAREIVACRCHVDVKMDFLAEVL